MTFALANFLKPFFMLLLGAAVLYPARRAVIRHMKDGPIKQALLFKVGGDGVKWTPAIALIWIAYFAIFFGFIGYLIEFSH